MSLIIQEGSRNGLLISTLQDHSISSLRTALNELTYYRGEGDASKAVVLINFSQGIDLPETAYNQLFHLLGEYEISQWIGIGKEIYKHAGLSSIASNCFESVEEFQNSFDLKTLKASSVLVAGPDVFDMNKIIQVFQGKSHPTTLKVNLGHLAHNLSVYKSKLSDDVKMMVMVKANGYGIGSIYLAQTLAHLGVDYLGVAYADEGVELRKKGVLLPIFVMNVPKEAVKTCVEHQLQPVIHSLPQFTDLCSELRFLKVAETFSVHLELETGMRRLGFLKEDLPLLLSRWQEEAGQLSIESIFSHFPAAGNEMHGDFTQSQIDQFKIMSDQLETLPGKKLRHLCNTSGIERWPSAHFDMVRLGIGLFGIGSSLKQELRPVASLTTKITQTQTIKAGESVGYGRSFIASKETTIATLPLGYADGLNRGLSNGKGRVLINGQLAQIVGKICMDMTMVDITGISAFEGDEAVIFGKNPRIETIAESLDTIGYEVLSGISQRVKRIYIHD